MVLRLKTNKQCYMFQILDFRNKGWKWWITKIHNISWKFYTFLGKSLEKNMFILEKFHLKRMKEYNMQTFSFWVWVKISKKKYTMKSWKFCCESGKSRGARTILFSFIRINLWMEYKWNHNLLLLQLSMACKVETGSVTHSFEVRTHSSQPSHFALLCR